MSSTAILTQATACLDRASVAVAAKDIDGACTVAMELTKLAIEAENKSMWRLASSLENEAERLNYWAWCGGDPA